jgi:hypothetical protein
MENPGTFHHHHLQLLLHAVEGHVLQGPVPVVIIVLRKKYIKRILQDLPYLAKLVTTRHHYHPFHPGESHSHVVLCRYPFSYFSLEINIS